MGEAVAVGDRHLDEAEQFQEIEAEVSEAVAGEPSGEEEEEDVIEDASELGEDDNDVAEVIEKVDGKDEP